MAPINIVVSNVKGGVGKTTSSVYLAAAAVGRGHDPVLLIDADRQASSAEWLEERPYEGVELVEAPSERTVARSMERHEGLGVVDTPPGDERIVRAAIERADAVVIPTRAGGVEFTRVVATIEMIPKRTPHGVVVCAARLGTNDLEETIAWWSEPGGAGVGGGPRAGGHRLGARRPPPPRGPRPLRHGPQAGVAQGREVSEGAPDRPRSTLLEGKVCVVSGVGPGPRAPGGPGPGLPRGRPGAGRPPADHPRPGGGRGRALWAARPWP